MSVEQAVLIYAVLAVIAAVGLTWGGLYLLIQAVHWASGW